MASEGSTTDLGYYYAPPEDVWWQAMDYATDEFLWILREVNWVRSQVEIEERIGKSGSRKSLLFKIRWIIQKASCRWFKDMVGFNPIKNETKSDFVISSQIDL